ncbi:hypothetical protein [Paenibacillus faecalis]|uniref:hypothetical protein n=1 Tax=Paenibacillus faecalis TaxID=2079532 RepID=UPI00131A5601|nr:hypothetical protein [Paenibacillus faecalis]
MEINKKIAELEDKILNLEEKVENYTSKSRRFWFVLGAVVLLFIAVSLIGYFFAEG